MAAALLDILKRADLGQYYENFARQGITQLESLAQLALKDYEEIGIRSSEDKRRLFKVVQDLRYERPTVENGLVSSAALKNYGQNNRAVSSGSGLPDIRKLSVTRRVAEGGVSPQSTVSSTFLPLPQSRSRSRTLPDQNQQPDFLQSKLSSGGLPSNEDPGSSEEEETTEIRRGSARRLNTYGIPIQTKRSMAHIPGPFASPGTSPGGALASPATTSLPSELNQKIRVCVRKRPLNKAEVTRGEKDISPTQGLRSIHINEPKVKVDLTKYIEQHAFTFDDVFDSDASNDKIYQRTAQPLVKYVFDGGKATCFAYGQTGSGKTYTMLDPQHGLYTLAANDVFKFLSQPAYEHLSAWIGFYEIYQGQLYDLLNSRKKLFAREDGKQNVVIVGLKEYVIKNVDDLMKVFEYVLQILLKPATNRRKIVGKLSFIDLAGSERGADRGETDMKTRMEGAEINKSLLALKECIRALDLDKKHTPFRQSKLTQVLKDSFVGNSRTCMIATISPNQSNSEHTLNTLRYADRVKELKGERDRRALGDAAHATQSPEEDDDEEVGDEGEQMGEDIIAADDLEQYNQSLFLDDEDFPSDGDGDILDSDFPHETSRRGFQEHSSTTRAPVHIAPPVLRGGMTQGDNHRPPLADRYDTQPVSSSPKSLYYTEEKRHSLDRGSNGPTHTPPVDGSAHHSPSSVSLSDVGQSYSQPQPNMSLVTAPAGDDMIRFDPQAIENFIQVHRDQIRQMNEYARKESSLLSRFSDSNLQPGSDDYSVSAGFIYYLDDLERILSKKMDSIETLRDRIRHVLGEEEFY